MNWFCGRQSRLLWPILLVLIVGVACSRSVRVPTEQGSAQADPAPFREDGMKSDQAGSADSSSSAAYAENGLPFHDSQNLPAGTLLMVRLKNAISPGRLGGHDSFQASLDDPIVVDGNTMLPRGVLVTGRVESVRLSKVDPSRGYIRLTLQSIHLAGVDVPLQTASLFVRRSNNGSVPTIRLPKGHRLTFRLTESVYTPTQTAHLNR